MVEDSKFSDLCPFLSKGANELTERERQTLLGLLAKTVTFIGKANIPPLPHIFYKWFLVHCYLTSKGVRNPSHDTLLKTYEYIEEQIEKAEATEREIQTVDRDQLQEALHIIHEITKLIETFTLTVEETEKRLTTHLKKALSKESPSQEDLKELLKALEYLKMSVSTDADYINKKLREVKDRINQLKQKIVLDIPECMKPEDFRSTVRRLLETSPSTGKFFSLVLVRINNWNEWQDMPPELKAEYLRRVCRIIKGELRSSDYLSCLKEEGILALLIRDVRLSIALRVVQRLEIPLSKVSIPYGSRTLKSSFAFAIVESKHVYTYEKMMEIAKKLLNLCPTTSNSIKTEEDLL